jgi:DNA-binding CsgD family transcriptional regulator
MAAATNVRDRDLRALADIVNADRPDVPPEGLPPSLLGDLARQIRCDAIAFGRFDSAQQRTDSTQMMADGDQSVATASLPVNWQHYWHCRLCSYPDRTGDTRSVVKTADFYSTRQWHGIGTRCGINQPMGFEHALMLTLPAQCHPLAATGGAMRLFFFRGPGMDFSERDRAALTLLRPHLHKAFLEAESQRHPIPRLTPRQEELLRHEAAGETNAKIARQLGITEGTVHIHLEHIYARLGASSRIDAVNRAFPAALARLAE